MNTNKNHITVFEYQKLWMHKGEQKLTQQQLNALEVFYGEQGIPYYSLIHKGISFGSYVGVIQVGETIIEVLPKADKSEGEEAKSRWRNMLINMLNAVDVFNIHAPSSSSLRLKANNILDLYFQLFIQEVEYLVQLGLIKKYRKSEGNSNALKGSLYFSKHIQQNLVHKERFYVRQTVYDQEHVLHQILLKAIKLLDRINSNATLKSKIGSLLLSFPEVQDVRINSATFERIDYNRKNTPYKNAIEIAKLLLLNYHPDVQRGRDDVLALMFDMNVLWEQFVYKSLKKNKPEGCQIHAQSNKLFWRKKGGRSVRMRPDIVIAQTDGNTVLDTKWKNIKETNPSSNDLRQMYVYHEYFDAKKVALVYPGELNSTTDGNYLHPDEQTITQMECAIIQLKVESNITVWQQNIGRYFHEYLNLNLKQDEIMIQP